MTEPLSKIVPTLWFDHDAEAAAHFHVSLLPGSRIEAVDVAALEQAVGTAAARQHSRQEGLLKREHRS